MALADLVPKLWGARFTTIYYYQMVWGMVVNRTYEGQISRAGDTVKIPTFQRFVTVLDYVKGTALQAAQSGSGTTQDLVIDKQKYFHALIEDIDMVQVRPALWNAVLFDAARKMAETVDTDIKTVIETAVNGLAASKYERLTGALSTYTTQAELSKIIHAIVDLKLKLDDLNVPMTARWLIVSPLFMSLISKYFLAADGSGIFTPVTNESVVRNGFSGRLLGFNLMMTTDVATATVATHPYHRLIAGQGNEWTSHAEQIMSVEGYRPEDGFQDAVKGLDVYGTKNISADYYTYLDLRSN